MNEHCVACGREYCTDVSGGNEYDGDLIVLEGIDFSGKTTLVDKLQGTYVPTAEPYTNLLERTEAHGGATALSRLYAFCADRDVHVNEVIRPELRAGNDVLVDRYVGSTLAYQSARLYNNSAFEELSDSRQFVRNVCATHTWPMPDRTILLDIPAEIAHARGAEESVDVLTAVRNEYLELYEPCENATVVDGSMDEGAVHSAVDRLT